MAWMRRFDRRAFLATLAAAMCAPAVGATAPPPRILLVCQFGSVKSAIARELLKRRAAERGARIVVTSRGITPEEHLPADLQSRLSSDGIDPRAQPLRKLDQKDLDEVDLVVFFDPIPSSFKMGPSRDWTQVPSILRQYPEARTDLERRIDALIAELKP